jgi:hypothetical protein
VAILTALRGGVGASRANELVARAALAAQGEFAEASDLKSGTQRSCMLDQPGSSIWMEARIAGRLFDQLG